MDLLDKYVPFNAAVKQWPLSAATYEAYSRRSPERLPPLYWFNERRYFLRSDVAAWEAKQIMRDTRADARTTAPEA